MTEIHTFGPALRAAREHLELSQSELARRAGMRPGDVSRFERGVREPRLSTLVRLARGTGVTPAELVDRLGPTFPGLPPLKKRAGDQAQRRKTSHETGQRARCERLRAD